MKCRYTPPPSREKRDYERRITAYTRGCLCAACVQVLYLDFGYAEKSRIPRFVDALHDEINNLDTRFGTDMDKQYNDIAMRLEKDYDIQYGRRYLSGDRGVNAKVHDVMTMAAMIVLIRDFGFGRKRTMDDTMDPESRLSLFFNQLKARIGYMNRVNAGVQKRDEIMYDEWLDVHLTGYGFSEEFIKQKIMKW